MTSAANLVGNFPFRGFLVGYPGSGKTGALASIANAGMKLRILAFDKKANMQSLIHFTKPEMLKNIDIVFLEDRMFVNEARRTLEVKGVPDAFFRGLKLLNHWKYEEEDGTEVDLGRPGDWGLDTAIVMDSLTSNGDAAMRRARAMLNSTALVDDRVYGGAQREQDALVDALMKSEAEHHVIILSHLKIVGPKEKRKGDGEITTQLKEAMAELVPTKLMPSAVGWQLPQQIARHASTMIEARTKLVGQKVKRVLVTNPKDRDIDLKVPAKVEDEYPIETGLASIFDAVSPGWRAAIEANQAQS